MPNIIVKPVARLLWLLSSGLLLSGLLSGCGSEDQLPGGTLPGESDPLAAGLTPLFYIERQITTDPDDLRDPLRFVGGGRLIMKDYASKSAPETVLSDRICRSNCDFRDLDVSYDGSFLLFSMMEEDPDPNDNIQYTWDLYEYDIRNKRFRKVIANDDATKFNHEITPRYLPNGDIVFASTRQKATRAFNQDTGYQGYSGMDEDGRARALNLHVINSSGDSASIRQITFNMSHDAYPAILPDGSILYTRWDNYNRNAMNLYRVNPDGTDNRIYYGMHSHNSGPNDSDYQFIKANILPTGDVFVLARPMQSDAYGGDFVYINIADYIDNTTPTAWTSGSGPAQQSITDTEVDTSSEFSPGGYYADFHPLWDGTDRALASWSMCRVANGSLLEPCTNDSVNARGAQAATPAYGIWMLNYTDNTQVPVILARSGVVITDIALGYPKAAPLSFHDAQPYTENNCLSPNPKLTAATQNELCRGSDGDSYNWEGVLHIRNVYDLDGTAPGNYSTLSNPSRTSVTQRPARFLRVVRGVPEPARDIFQPDPDAFGNAGGQRMKHIVGYAPIEPDGSVKVRVPANVPLSFSITDASGQSISDRHQNWISLRPGEVLECMGCHSANSTEPHGRYYAQPNSSNQGKPTGSTYSGATSQIRAPFDYATMAEARFAYIEDNLAITAGPMLKLNQNPRFTFNWQDPGHPLTADDMEVEDPASALWYANIPAFAGWTQAQLPASNQCPSWNYRCLIKINYPDHIQPLWEFARTNLATDGQPATCVRCHTRSDGMGGSQVPAGQLELTSEVDTGIRMRSYDELFFADITMLDDGTGTVVDCTQQVPRVDANGNPVLDENNQQYIDTVLCDPTEGPYLFPAGARASSGFFNLFAAGGSHAGYMNAAELRLLAEWLDIGGQYYNDLFAAPAAN